MKKNDVASFFYYMWNCWDRDECEIVFSQSKICEWQHFWKKYCQYAEKYEWYGAVEAFFSELSEYHQDLLVARAVELYDRKKRIK